MRIALVSTHTLPSAPPGSGDAGGMNVCILQLARGLRARGHDIDVVTAPRDLRGFDVVHSHYWRSGLVALDQGVPFVHSMHTMGLVKNAAGGAESAVRIAAERAIVRAASGLVGSTSVEAEQLMRLYGADPARIHVVPPGVDREVFRPQPERREDDLIVFAGRLQPLKAPDVLLRAAALIGRPVRVAVIGGPAGPEPMDLPALAASLGLEVTFVPPLAQPQLADWLAAATLVAVPSYSESFGLVALEAQACGTPVVAARVGGLPTAVVDGVTGVLVDGHDPARWAGVLGELFADRPRRTAMGAKAVAHAEGFSWDATVDATLAVYESVVGEAP